MYPEGDLRKLAKAVEANAGRGVTVPAFSCLKSVRVTIGTTKERTTMGKVISLQGTIAWLFKTRR